MANQFTTLGDVPKGAILQVEGRSGYYQTAGEFRGNNRLVYPVELVYGGYRPELWRTGQESMPTQTRVFVLEK